MAASAQTPLPAVIVTANPLGSIQMSVPAIQYSGAELLLRSKSTLGETLDGTPGVASTYFGPNASRPVIRGLDGDRIRILDNGGSALDASALSQDHAVPLDGLAIERVDILRGPAALMYGGSAAGGVVNVIDNRIAAEAGFGPQGGVTGKADVVGSTEDGGREIGVMLEAGTDRFTLHVDAFDRRSGDVAAPIGLACTKPGSPASSPRMCNSANEAGGGALGGTLHLTNGFLGLSASQYRSQYGVVAEDEVDIRMRSDRQMLLGEWRALSGLVQSLRFQWTQSQYTHTEFDAGAPGTVFKSDDRGLRLEAKHLQLGRLQGVVGLSHDRSNFSADGTEAFAPFSQTQANALFVHEELPLSWGSLNFGARWEQVDVASGGHPRMARFAAAQRQFQPTSQSVGLIWKPATQSPWQVHANLAFSERAPKDHELFADGPHVATNAYEVGLPSATTERSTQFDLGVAWKQGNSRWGLSGFVNQFHNHLLLESTGVQRDSDGNGGNGVSVTDSGNGDNTSLESGGTASILPEFAYRQVAARFAGLEWHGGARLFEGASSLDLELRGDVVRAVNHATGQPLPRVVPARVGASLVWRQGPWGLRMDMNHVAAQDQVPAGGLATGAYTLLNLSAQYKAKLGLSDVVWYLRGDNVTDQLAYSVTSILTQTAPGKAPLPGRNWKFGMRLAF